MGNYLLGAALFAGVYFTVKAGFRAAAALARADWWIDRQLDVYGTDGPHWGCVECTAQAADEQYDVDHARATFSAEAIREALIEQQHRINDVRWAQRNGIRLIEDGAA